MIMPGFVVKIFCSQNGTSKLKNRRKGVASKVIEIVIFKCFFCWLAFQACSRLGVVWGGTARQNVKRSDNILFG